MKYKVGDRVIMAKGSWYIERDGIPAGSKGVVVGIDTNSLDFDYQVQWAEYEANFYNEEDLEWDKIEIVKRRLE